MTMPILEARDLSKLFPGPKKLFTPARFVTAVDRVSMSVMPGETLAIVGESGSGKSTLGRLLLRLLGASEGRVFYQGEEITHASGARLNQLRRELQIIFQDPFASLNPRMTVEQIVGEPLWLHQNMKKNGSPVPRLRATQDGRLALSLGRALSTRIFRRAAPAYRHCARAGIRPKAAAG